jgi:hypothetical protein
LGTVLPSPSLGRPRDLIVHWLHDIGHHGAGRGLDEGVDRHAGDELQTVEARQFVIGNTDAHGVVAFALLLFLRDIGADPHDLAVELGRDALVEGTQAQHGALAHMDLIDLVRRDPRLDGEAVAVGHDQHDGLAPLDDAADRVHALLKDLASLRRDQVDALEQVFGGDAFFNQLGFLAADVGQLLADLGAQVLVDLQDFQLGLGNAAPGLGSRCDQAAALALQPRAVALQRSRITLDGVPEPVVLGRTAAARLREALADDKG